MVGDDFSVCLWGSVIMWESIVEIYSDAQTFGQKSPNTTAISNSGLAISWLEATFPELDQGKEVSQVSAVKARPYVMIDTSLSLQVFFWIIVNFRLAFLLSCYSNAFRWEIESSNRYILTTKLLMTAFMCGCGCGLVGVSVACWFTHLLCKAISSIFCLLIEARVENFLLVCSIIFLVSSPFLILCDGGGRV